MKLNKRIKLVFTIASLIFIGGSVLGTLLTPAVLAVTCSFYWLFLYVVYFIVILYAALCFVKYWNDDNGTRK